jgi:uracil-DNA glycosylase family 4
MAHLHPHRGDDDQIFQKYLDKAIAEINALADEMEACTLCDHEPGFRPVLGTGHPLADVFLLKFRPRPSELEQGVAFYGRAGEAILKSTQRLLVDPLDIYGSNCIKCSGSPDSCALRNCPSWLRTEIGIVSPRMLVVMGREALEVVNGMGLDDASVIEPTPGSVQRWTHTCEALWCPDIDDSLDGPASKQAFWDAFRQLGGWYAARPPW